LVAEASPFYAFSFSSLHCKYRRLNATVLVRRYLPPSHHWPSLETKRAIIFYYYITTLLAGNTHNVKGREKLGQPHVKN
jgi:hypothetical protein